MPSFKVYVSFSSELSQRGTWSRLYERRLQQVMSRLTGTHPEKTSLQIKERFKQTYKQVFKCQNEYCCTNRHEYKNCFANIFVAKKFKQACKKDIVQITMLFKHEFKLRIFSCNTFLSFFWVEHFPLLVVRSFFEHFSSPLTSFSAEVSHQIGNLPRPDSAPCSFPAHQLFM